LDNQEIITSKPFILDDKNQKGTIGNWLKDFIKQNGSQLFNTIILSSYLTASLNFKILDPEEKQLINRLLKLYRNLAFFPESMAGIPTEKWEIFPIEKKIEEAPIPKSTIPSASALIRPAVSTYTPVRPVVSVSAPVSPIAPAANFAPARVAPLSSTPNSAIAVGTKELESLLKQYPANSLQSKAIAAELKRLQSK
jgi:hypothetical protein